MLGNEEASARRTNLIIRNGVSDVLDQVTELVHIVGAVHEPRNLASLFQWDEMLENIIQFPTKPRVKRLNHSTLESAVTV